MRILIIEDEVAMREALKDNLTLEGYSVTTAEHGQAGLNHMRNETFHLVILDVMMPGKDGFEVLAEMRELGHKAPVLFLTALGMDESKIKGLRMGADDYVTKPFNLMELIARVGNILRRTCPGSELNLFKLDEIVVDLKRQVIEREGQEETLGYYELEIMRLLASEPGRVFSRDEILGRVWGQNNFPSNRTIDNQIVKLRKKLGDDPKSPRYIKSIYKKGYQLLQTGLISQDQ